MFDIDVVIRNLTSAFFVPLTLAEMQELCKKAGEVFMSEPMLLELHAPINFVGDIHGQFTDLLRIFEAAGHPSNTKYLFLGDYVDRGLQSIETICLLLAFKVKYKNSFYVLRGNHENYKINGHYGFYEECVRRFDDKLWETFNDVFDKMPVAAIVEKTIFCCHGGLSPDLESMDQIRQITRPAEVPDEGLMCDLLWADPKKRLKGWGDNEERQISVTFGADVVAEFLAKHDLQMIVRAHEVVEGFEFFAKRRLITLFSAPNYENGTNRGAVMIVDRNLAYDFIILE